MNKWMQIVCMCDTCRAKYASMANKLKEYIENKKRYLAEHQEGWQGEGTLLLGIVFAYG